MSRAAYLEIYGQDPPADAIWGADISWYQATNGLSLDSAVLDGTWADLVGWAQWVTIRASYGSSGDDGAQGAHVEYADRHGFTGRLGGYHFFYANNVAAQANNYLNRIAGLRDRFTHHMCDAEASPVAPAAQIAEFCDRVSQATGQPCVPYAGWSYLNQSGDPGRHGLWLPHYASASYRAWAPAPGSADLWQAPYTPDFLGYGFPLCWQFGSLSATHGHLDLNMGNAPFAQLLGVGGSLGPASTPTTPPSPWEEDEIMRQYRDVSTQTVYAVFGCFKCQLESDEVRQAWQTMGILAPPDQYFEQSPGVMSEFLLLNQDTFSSMMGAIGGVSAQVGALAARPPAVTPPAPILPVDKAAVLAAATADELLAALKGKLNA